MIEDGVTTVAISPSGDYVAAGSLDKSVRVWDARSGILIARLDGMDGHKDSVYSVAFGPDGETLVSGSLDKTIKMWQLSPDNRGGMMGGGMIRGGRLVRTFEGHKVSDAIGSCKRSTAAPNTKLVGLCSQCGTYSRWRVGPEWFEGQRGSVLEPTHRRHATDASGPQEFRYESCPQRTRPFANKCPLPSHLGCSKSSG